jgi:hypothetical protein
MRGKAILFGTGVAIGVVADRVALELRKPAAEQFPALRRTMNGRVNPWLLEHGYPGGEHAGIGILEHVGRATNRPHLTPVHPTLRDDTVLVPAPLGDGSQWARNVLHAGSARLQIHDELLDLDRPELITIADSGLFPPGVASPFDRMGWRYVRFHVVARVPGSFSTRRLPAVTDAAHEGVPLDRSFPLDAASTTLEPVGAG